MKTHRGLLDAMCAPAALDAACRLAARGKRRRPDVAWTLFNWDAIRRSLARGLHDGTWQPAGFDVHEVRDPKRRLISAAPFEDRVVHTALTEQF